MRKTNVDPKTLGHDWPSLQDSLDKFWNLIEDKYEEEWRVEYNGDMILVVDGEFMEQILMENYAQAWLSFGTWAGGRNAEGESFLLDMPLHLMGEYIIKGVYNERQALVDGPRSYFFEPEGA